MANFDMVPPDANELFGFNGPPNPKTSMVNWKLISVVVLILTLGIFIGNERRKEKSR